MVAGKLPPAGVSLQEGLGTEEPDVPGTSTPASVLLPDDVVAGALGEEERLGEVLRRHGIRALVLLTAVNFLDSLESQAFALLGPEIQADLGLSDTALGGVASLAAALFVVAAVPIGYLADRTRRVPLAAACTAIAGLATLATAAATNTWQLAVARFANGAGKASTLPVHNSLLSDCYPPGSRARVLAGHNLAPPIGALLGPVAVGLTAGMVGGWRGTLSALAVATVVVAGILLLVREPARGSVDREAALGRAVTAEPAPPPSYSAAFARLRSIETVRWLLLGVGVLGFVLVAVPVFLNLLLEEAYSLGVLRRGSLVSVTEVGSLAGVIVGGIAGERLLRRDPPAAIRWFARGTAVYGVVFSLAILIPNLAGLVIGVTVANFILYASTVSVYAFVAAVVPYRIRSLGFALLGIYIFLLGGFLGGIFTGLISDARSPRFALAVVTAPVCVVAAALAGRGSRFVKADISSAVADVLEEDEWRKRRSARGTVPVLEVRNLDAGYDGTPVLFGVDLDVQPGETLALLGTNGAGKSTVLRAVSGLLVPTRGAIRVDGRDMTLSTPVDRIGAGLVQMPGGKAVFPGLTVFENLLAGTHSFAWDRTKVRDRITEVVRLFPALEPKANQPAGSLSGGEQQMLGLARALLLEPRLLMIDELTLGLSPQVVGDLLQALDQVRRQGVSLLVVEQSVSLALEIADRAVFMEKGRVRFEGPAADLTGRDDLLRAVFLGSASGVKGRKK
jgi:ABC-type branched-subunit amino acid transport system ATPase component/predicted MFS family arabinose efflux permease